MTFQHRKSYSRPRGSRAIADYPGSTSPSNAYALDDGFDPSEPVITWRDLPADERVAGTLWTTPDSIDHIAISRQSELGSRTRAEADAAPGANGSTTTSAQPAEPLVSGSFADRLDGDPWALMVPSSRRTHGSAALQHSWVEIDGVAACRRCGRLAWGGGLWIAAAPCALRAAHAARGSGRAEAPLRALVDENAPSLRGHRGMGCSGGSIQAATMPFRPSSYPQGARGQSDWDRPSTTGGGGAGSTGGHVEPSSPHRRQREG